MNDSAPTPRGSSPAWRLDERFGGGAGLGRRSTVAERLDRGVDAFHDQRPLISELGRTFATPFTDATSIRLITDLPP